MEKLSNLDIIRLANASPKAAALIKQAADFDEQSQGNQPPVDPSQQQVGTYPSNQAMPQKQQDVPPDDDEFAAVPEEEMMGEEMPVEETPEDVGARAAQSFMAPFFDAAMQGDPNAQQMVARAAGQIASSTAESYANASSMPQDMGGMPPEGEMPPEGDMQQGMGAPAISTPEEDLANEIIQDVPAPVPQQGGEGGGEGVGEEGAPKEEKNGKKGTFPPKKNNGYGKTPEKK